MAETSRYCKAYYVSQLRKFNGWKENLANLAKEKTEIDGKEVEVARDSLKDTDFLYLQENYVVTNGIFKDQNIIFDDVTEEWRNFCHQDFKFAIPEYLTDSKA